MKTIRVVSHFAAIERLCSWKSVFLCHFGQFERVREKSGRSQFPFCHVLWRVFVVLRRSEGYMLEKTEETGRTFPLKKYIDYELKAIIMVLAVFWLHAFFCVEVLQTWGTLL